MRPLNEIRNYMRNYQVKSGVYHYYRQEYKQALGFLRKALQDEGALDDADAVVARCYLALSLTGLADKLAASGETAAAIEELESAAEVRSDFPDIHFRIATLLERLGRVDEAIEAYRRALELNPGYVDACVALGGCLAAVGRLGDAEQTFARALELRIARMRKPFDRGVERLRAGEVAPALERMHEVFRAVPQLSGLHLAVALDWIKAEEYEKAVLELDRAIQLNPSYPDLHNFRGIALCEAARPLEAVAAFRRASELCPGQVVPRLNIAFAYLRANQIDEAQGELQSVLETHPGEPVAVAKLEELRQADRRATSRPSG